jgi:CRP-like cAMP-binding protein
MTIATIRRLATLDLFANCRRAELARVDQLGTALDVPAHRTLCQAGADGGEFFVLLEGTVTVEVPGDTAALMHAGAWFGEAALLHDGVRRATVTTATPALLLVFSRSEFFALLETAPCICARVTESAGRVVQGNVPTRASWYQPLPAGFSFMLGPI